MAAVAATLACFLAACTTPQTADGAGSNSGTGVTDSGTVVHWSADPAAPSSGATPPELQWRRSVTLTSLSLPAEMSMSADRIDLDGMIAPAGDGPAAAAAIRTQPSGHRDLQVSTWDGAAWQPHTFGTGGTGEPQRVEIAGAAGISALAGWAWAPGPESAAVAPFLLTSPDRRSWTAVELPDSLDGYRLVAADTDGARVVAVGENNRGAAVVVTVDGTGEPAVVDLPRSPDRQRRSITDVTVSGSTVLVTTGRDAAHNGPPRVLRSTDSGRTWADPTPMAESEWARVYGVTAVTGGFLATGADRIGPDSSDRHATAWFSADGATWQAEVLPEPDGFRRNGDDSRAGDPTASGASAFTVVASDSVVAPQVVARRATGEWVALGAPAEEVAGGFGFGGWAVPAGTDPSGEALIGIQGTLGATFGRLAGGGWTTMSGPANAQQLTTFRSAPSAEQQLWKADLQQPHFDRTEGIGWNRWLALSSVGLTGDTLAVVPPDPPEATRWTLRASSGTAELAVVSDFVANRLAVLGWYRPASDQPWVQTAGFGGDPWEQASAADNVGGLWLIAGGHRAQITSNGVEQAMIWYSSDGVSWARADGDFAQEDRASRIVGFCSAPGGGRAAVGEVTTAGGSRQAALWIEQDGRWQRNELPTDAGWTSSFTSCVDVAGTLVVNGSLGSGVERWSWTPGPGFTELDAPPIATDGPPNPGTREFRDVAAVAGGYVAVGRLDATAHTGPVIWLSADGRQWQWLPLPVNRPDAWSISASVGNDLLLLTSSTTGSQAWRIADIASVIAAIPAQSRHR